VNQVEWIINASQLAPFQLIAEGTNGSRDDVGRDLVTLRKEDQDVDDLPGQNVGKSWCFTF